MIEKKNEDNVYTALLTPEQRAYLSEVQRASKIVEKVMQSNSSFDCHDLFRISLLLNLSPSERLKLGLQRRVIRHVD